MGSVDPVARRLLALPAPIRSMIVLGGAVLVHLSLGTYHTFGNMLPYMASYIRNRTEPSVTNEQLIWIPTLQGCFPFAMLLGGILTTKIGCRAAAMVGCLLMNLGVLLSHWSISTSAVSFVLTYGAAFGLGQAIAYVAAVVCAINWCPDQVGLVSGIVAAGFGCSASFFAPLQTRLVNPWNYAPNKEGYFVQPDLLDRVPGLFLRLSAIYAVMQLLGLVVICEPPEKTPSRRSLYRPPSGNGLSSNRISSTSSSSSDNAPELDMEVGGENLDLDDALEEDEQDLGLEPLEMLRTPTFYWLFAAMFCCSFYANMFYTLYKTWAETFIEDDMFLAVTFSAASLANAAARIFWGWLTDVTSFQLALSCACCCATSLLLTMPLCELAGRWLFVVWLLLTFVCMAATHALFITVVVRCFGARHKATNYGLLILSTTLSGILLSLVAQYALATVGYHRLFFFTACFPFAAFLITCAVEVRPHTAPTRSRSRS